MSMLVCFISCLVRLVLIVMAAQQGFVDPDPDATDIPVGFDGVIRRVRPRQPKELISFAPTAPSCLS
jgi:hypothetical protein